MATSKPSITNSPRLPDLQGGIAGSCVCVRRVSCTKTGKAIDRSNVWREMKKLEQPARVSGEKIFPHNLRHLFARIFYQETKNLVILAEILGHSNLETTRIYTMETIEKYQRLLEKIGGILEL